MIFIKKIRLPSLVLIAAVVLAAAGGGIFMLSRHTVPASSIRDTGEIEIFDIEKGEVVKRAQAGRTEHKEAERLIGKVSGLYQKIKPFPEKGIIIRIPLDPALEVRNKHVTGSGINFADVLYLIFPDEGGQYLMLLDSRQRPWFYVFKGNTGIFSKYKR